MHNHRLDELQLEFTQPWFSFSTKNKNVLFTPESSYISHFYSFCKSSNEKIIAIPDGCVDILFDFNNTESKGYIVGTPLNPIEDNFKEKHHYFGVRFRPGIIPDLLNLDINQLISNRIDITEFDNNYDSIIKQLSESENFTQKVYFLNHFINQLNCRRHSELTMSVIRKIIHSNGNLNINSLTYTLNYSVRNIQRIFKCDMGLTPKEFSQIIRCQSAIYEINHNSNLKLSELAFNLGFSDQAHFQREFKKRVGITPNDYKRLIRETFKKEPFDFM